MGIKIFITREVPTGKVEKFAPLLRRMRAHCLTRSGSISGQTRKRQDRLNHWLVISTWRSMRDWHNWFNNDRRRTVQMEINTLLGTETAYGLYT